MGIIVRRDVSSTGITEAQAQTQTEAAPDTSSDKTSDSSAETAAQTADPAPTETNTQPPTSSETEAASATTDNTTPSPEPTTAQQQQPGSSDDKQTETEKQTDNDSTPSPTQDGSQDSDRYEPTSSDDTLNSPSSTQATLAITSSTLPTSISIPISSPASTVVQSVSAVPSCSADAAAAAASNSLCTNSNSDSNNSQLSGGAIAGIVVGALAALAIICGCLLFKRRRNSRTEPPPRQSFLFIDEKPVLQSEPGSDLPSNTSDYQSENTFGVHLDSQATIPRYESPATTFTSEMKDPSKGLEVATALYPPIKRNKSNEYMQANNRMSVAADTDNYTQSAMKLFQPPSRAMSPASGRESQLSNNSNNQSKRSIYRPSLHQSQLMPESSDVDHLKRESTIDPYSNNKPMSLWDDKLQPQDDIRQAYNADFEWTHDNGYIQPPLYRP